MPFSVRRWTPDLSVNHLGMDDQHRNLLTLAERLYTSAEHDEDCVTDLVHELVDATYRHIADEDALLVQIGYPEFKAHQRSHQQIHNALDRIVDKLATTDRRVFTSELSRFISDWLVRHIMNEDMKYGQFIAESRMRRAEDLADPRGVKLADPRPSDPLERLRRLKAALKEGLISEQDYEARKSQILSEF